jgi:hypothetical protein
LEPLVTSARDSGRPCAVFVKPGIHRVDPESGSTLKALIGIFQSNCWVNLRILGQPCGFHLLADERARARARSRCRVVLTLLSHPLHTRSPNIIGASLSEAAMRPNPSAGTGTQQGQRRAQGQRHAGTRARSARICSTGLIGAIGGRCIGTIGVVYPGTLFHRRQRGIPMHSHENRSQIRALGVEAHRPTSWMVAIAPRRRARRAVFFPRRARLPQVAPCFPPRLARRVMAHSPSASGGATAPGRRA